MLIYLGGHRGLEMCPGVMGDVRPTRFERLTPETYFHMGKTVPEEPGPTITPADANRAEAGWEPMVRTSCPAGTMSWP